MCKEEVHVSTTDLQIFSLSEVDRDTLKERKKKDICRLFCYIVRAIANVACGESEDRSSSRFRNGCM